MSAFMTRLASGDERVLRALASRRRDLLDRVMRLVTHLGDAVVVTPITFALAFGVMPGLRDAGRIAAFTLTFSHLLVQLLKRTIERPRPDLPVGCESLIDAPDRFSFPSGHATASLSLALGLSTVLPASIAAGILALAVMVGFSRCYLGVHYPSDVMMGWLLAGITMLLAGPLLGL